MIVVKMFFAFVAMIAVAVEGGDPPTTQLPTRTIQVQQDGRTETLIVEIASTPQQRQKGLMNRAFMPESAGMLFLFKSNSSGGFWMRNTYIPLDIAYVGADGTVQEIRAGETRTGCLPGAEDLDCPTLPPEDPYRYVLEVNRGWFERHGMGVGAKLTLPEDLPEAK